jgi:quercetin dioxygenase-like cupin family protein
MTTRFAWFVAGVVLTVGAGAVWAAKKEAVFVTPEELKWVDVPLPVGAPAAAGGAQVANVVGDAFKGAYSAFAKIPAGQNHPLHTHSSDVKAVVVSGTFIVTPEGGTEKKLGPGSFFMVPANMKHTSGCAPGAACVLFQEGPAKFDMKPVAEKGEAAGGKKPAAPEKEKK